MKSIFTYTLTLFATICFAQQIQWITKQSGVYNQLPTGNRLATSKAGESHVVATFSGQAVVGTNTLFASGSTAAYFAKFDPMGSVLWARKITSTNYSTGEAISIDPLKNVFVTGKFATNGTFETSTITTSGSTDVLFVTKYDQGGNLKWVKKFSGTGGASPLSIKNDSLSNSYITGYMGGQVVFGTNTLTAINQDIFVLKLDSLGNVLWAVRFGGNTQVNSYDLTVDRNLNTYLIGHFGNVGSGGNQKLMIGTTTLSANLMTPDIFFAKLDINGNPVYAKKLGGNFSGDRGLGITYDGKDHVYLTGGFEGTAVFDTYTVNASQPITGKYAAFIAKFDLNGNCKWAKRPDTLITSQTWDVHCGDRNSIYIAGEPLSSVVFKFDSLGNQKWFYETNSSGGGSGFSLSSDQNGAVYLHSTFSGTLSTNIATLSTGSSNIFNNYVAKLDTSKIVITGIYESLNSTYRIFPNPATSELNIVVANGLNNISYIEIFTLSGESIYHSENQTSINIENLQDGLYILRILSSDGQSKYMKFIKL